MNATCRCVNPNGSDRDALATDQWTTEQLVPLLGVSGMPRAFHRDAAGDITWKGSAAGRWRKAGTVLTLSFESIDAADDDFVRFRDTVSQLGRTSGVMATWT